MQVIESSLFTILVPDKGYKLVNKNTGKCSQKVYLGKLDSVDNYTEVIDEKYINMDYVVELNDMKLDAKEKKNNDEGNLDMLLLSINKLYTMFEPFLAMMPMTLSDEGIENVDDPLINVYSSIVKRGLMKLDEIPAKYREQVRELL